VNDILHVSALEGKAPESRIREAVLSGFNVTRKSVFESRVSFNRDNEVVPAVELIQRQLVFRRLMGMQKLRAHLACIGIEYANFGVLVGDIGDFLFD
jgi:hypothetical protein